MTKTPFRSLRSWLAHLALTERLAVARPGLALRHEIAAVAKRLDGRQASLFPSPDGHAIPVISGLTSSRAWMAEALGVDESGLIARFHQAANNPLPWREVASAPVQEVVHRQIDLLKLLPVPIHNEHDSGPYITAGLLIARDPVSGSQNVAIHRCQINSRDRIGILLLPRHTLHLYRSVEQAGRPLEIAIVIGVDPATLLSSQAIAPLGEDELRIAGALHGEPLEVVKCLTSDVRVPAGAEIVIEGRLLPGEREPEGPFGEFPQYYGVRGERHVIAVDAVTHRAAPLFHTINGGGLEHLLLGAIPREATLLSELRRLFPEVEDVHLSLGGTCRYHLFVKIRKSQEGQGKNVIMAAFAAHYDLKHVVVVDSDVDIHNPTEVEWAISTRSQADRDVLIIPHAQGSKLDPSMTDGVGAKMGIDATVPLDAPPMRFKRIRVPGEDSVDLGRMIDGTGDWRRFIGD